MEPYGQRAPLKRVFNWGLVVTVGTCMYCTVREVTVVSLCEGISVLLLHHVSLQKMEQCDAELQVVKYQRHGPKIRYVFSYPSRYSTVRACEAETVNT
jgi:hypothetical protein